MRFPAATKAASLRDGHNGNDPVIILSVGRAVEKKGYDDLLAALAQLPANLSWRFVHIGGGPLLESLKALAGRLGIAARIQWRGPQDQAGILAELRAADVFALASRIASDGDRDGLPNVLLEALSQSLCVAATRAGAIAELIVDGENGLLVEPGDPASLAAALGRLIGDPDLRAKLGAAGAIRLRQEFSLDACIERLAVKFGLASAAPALSRSALSRLGLTHAHRLLCPAEAAQPSGSLRRPAHGAAVDAGLGKSRPSRGGRKQASHP